MSSDEIYPVDPVGSRIIFISGQRIMLSNDLAELYGVEVFVLMQAVKRNINRFPPGFMFKLTKDEWVNMKSQNVMSTN